MSLKEQIHSEITAAMRSGATLRRDVLRMAENAVNMAEKRDRRAYADDEVVAILAREVKTRRESIEAFEKGGRADLVDKEAAEIAILQAFLPAALSPAELDALVAQGIAETGASGPREMGKVMGWLAPRTRGRVDGRELSTKVTAALATGARAGFARAASDAAPAKRAGG